MSDLTTQSTVYVIYIAASPQRVWQALTSAECTSQYFFGRTVDSDWRAGSPWVLRTPDGRVEVQGEVRESDPPRRLVVSWNLAADASLPECLVSYDVEQVGENLVRLTMIEAHPTPIPAHLLEGGRQGWPMILSGLKTLLETGRPLSLPVPHPT